MSRHSTGFSVSSKKMKHLNQEYQTSALPDAGCNSPHLMLIMLSNDTEGNGMNMLLSWPDFTAEVKFMVKLYHALNLKENVRSV